MFVISCKYDGAEHINHDPSRAIPKKSPIRECIHSIVEFHPQEKIVVVDSDSGDKSYFLDIEKYDNVIIMDCKNQNRVCGSFYEAYKKFPDEKEYIVIHDSLVFNNSIQKFIDSDVECFSLMYFMEHYLNWQTQHDPYCWEILDNSEYERPKDGSVLACYGPMFIVKNRIAKTMERKKLFENLKVRNKTECATWEKIFGQVFIEEGYPPSEYNIQGDYKTVAELADNGGLEYFKKQRLGRA
jgi:hypothetical protein